MIANFIRTSVALHRLTPASLFRFSEGAPTEITK
jgi:hypothetical protein